MDEKSHAAPATKHRCTMHPPHAHCHCRYRWCREAQPPAAAPWRAVTEPKRKGYAQPLAAQHQTSKKIVRLRVSLLHLPDDRPASHAVGVATRCARQLSVAAESDSKWQPRAVAADSAHATLLGPRRGRGHLQVASSLCLSGSQ